MAFGFFLLVIVVFAFLASSVRVLQEYERGVVFRLGRVLSQPKGPGLVFLIPVLDRLVRVSTRIITMDIEPQDVITRDNVSIKVNAVLYFRVVDPVRAVINVENYLYATSQLAQTHLRSTLGEHTMDELLVERDRINAQLQIILDRATDSWGIKVTAVEVKQLDLPPDMLRAMARQAEAERERRAKLINAEGEFQAATKLVEAANLMATHPMTLQLRYLQTLQDISIDNKTLIVFPLPIDVIKAFTDNAAAATKG